MYRQLLTSLAAAVALLAAAPALAEDLLLDPESALNWQLFEGPYIGASGGYGNGSPNATLVAAVGYNWFLTDNLYAGIDVTGIIYNDGVVGEDSHMTNAKLGVVVDRATIYGMLGAGRDTNVASGWGWRATAGAEYLVTDAIGINAEVSSTQSFGTLGDVIQGQLGVRIHTDAYRGPLETFDYSNIGVLQSMQNLGEMLHIDEVRLGPAFSNLELNAFRMPLEPDLLSFKQARLDSAMFEVIMQSPDLFAWIGGARPNFGGVISFSGHESFLHAGLNWQYQFGDSPWFVEAGLGLAVHNGYMSSAPAGYRNLGCPVLAQWQYGVGYDVNDKVTVSATWKHISGVVFNCSPNDGINTFGLTAGWKF